MNETRKIAFACFIGGAICSAVALLLAPTLWWLGMLAGFAGGYLSYEFREVIKATSVAWRVAKDDTVDCWVGMFNAIRKWLLEPHHVLYPSVTITVALYALTAYWMYYTSIPASAYVLVAGMFLLAYFPVERFFLLCVHFGVRKENCFYYPFAMPDKYEADIRKRLEKEGLKQVPMTYKSEMRWFFKGLALICFNIVCKMPKAVAIGFVSMCSFFFRYGWFLFKLIHSQKHVLCGLDGVVGGTVSYLWLSSSGHPVLVVLFGGLLGAMFGILNWEVVSVRWLKVQTRLQ